MIWAIIIAGMVGATLGVFAMAACCVAGRADDMNDAALRQLMQGDAAPVPTIDSPHHAESDSR